MIKNLKKFSKEDEKRRLNYLRRLSLKDSCRIVEEILSSALMLKMKFADDDRPVALFKLMKGY